MNKEDYRILKEINSLNNELDKNQALIDDQLHRVVAIERQRGFKSDDLTLTEDSLSKARTELNQIENNIAHGQKLLDQSKSNKANVFTQVEIESLQAQIDRSANELDELETRGLELMDEIETLESDARDAKTFLAGTLETIDEITEEVIESNAPTINAIKILEGRIDLLFIDLPEKVVSVTKKLIEKKLIHGPFTSLNANQCRICGYTLPVKKSEDIEKRLLFTQCSSCRRIYIPETSLY